MEQFHRVERYLQRIRDVYAGCPHIFEDEHSYEDDVVSFFIHCHHLSDWIVELNRAGATRAEVNTFLNAHLELRVCADLCNRSKHCRIERARSGHPHHLAGRTWTVTTYTPATGKPVTFQASYKVISEHAIYDALALAEQCLSLWRDFSRSLALRVI